MKEIYTSKNIAIQVSDEDFDWLNSFNWHINSNGYAIRNYGGHRSKQKYMHREILGLTKRSEIADHKDRNRLNNQRDNLRLATNSQNAANKNVLVSKTSIYRGVSLYRTGNQWDAFIKFECKHFFLGRFNNEYEAALAYDKKALELHGEFASLNFKKP